MRLLCLTIFLFLFSCQKSTDIDFIWADAKVVSTADINCGLPVLLFEDSVTIRNFTGVHSIGYLAHGMPSQLNTLGLNVSIKIARLPDSEAMPCITLGPTMPDIKVLKARAK